MVIIICKETRSTQIGSVSVIKMHLFFFSFSFGEVHERTCVALLKYKAREAQRRIFNIKLMGDVLTSPLMKLGSRLSSSLASCNYM